jgi:hypothetical protein
LRAEKHATEPKKSADSKHSAGQHHVTPAISKAFRKITGSTSSARVPQVLAVGSELLAAGFATGNNYARTAEHSCLQ